MNATGERFIPDSGMGNEIEMEHMQRYCAVAPYVKGMNVLDAACGVGYGTRLLSDYADSVTGIDIDTETVEYATRNNSADNISFRRMSIGEMSFENNSFDAVISFETIEHVDEDLQEKFLQKVSQILKPDGFLVISTPDYDVFRQKTFGTYVNPFHVKEYNKSDFENLLKKFFPCVEIHTQEHLDCCVIDGEGDVVFGEKEKFSHGEYIIAVCSKKPLSLNLGSVYLPKLNDKRARLVSAVYFDYGSGYNSDDKIAFSTYHEPDGSFTLEINPDRLSELKRIRINPCYFPAYITLFAYDCEGNEYSPSAMNKTAEKNGMELFMHSDASYELKMDSFAGRTPITVKGRLRKCTQEEKDEYNAAQSAAAQSWINADGAPVFFFWDLGDGYNDDSHCEVLPDIDSETGISVINIKDIPSGCRKVRFDPALDCRCLVSNLHISTNIKDCESRPLNGTAINGIIAFANTSPQIEFDLPDGTEWIEIRARISKCRGNDFDEIFSSVQEIPAIKQNIASLENELNASMAAHKLQEQKFAEERAALKEKVNEAYGKNAQLINENKVQLEINNDLNRKIADISAKAEEERANMDLKIRQITNELNRARNEYNVIVRSKCWRLTSPIRKTLDWMKRRKTLRLIKKGLVCLKTSGFKATCKKIKVYFKSRKSAPSASNMYSANETARIESFSGLISAMSSVEGTEVYLSERLLKYDKSQEKKILLVSHELNLTGAPVAIYYFAQVLKEEGFSPLIISPRTGKLIDSITSSDIPVIVCPALYTSAVIRSFAELFDLVIANTIVSAPVINMLDGTDIPVYWWIHEAEASYTDEFVRKMPCFLTDTCKVGVVGDYALARLKQHRPEYTAEQLLYYIPDYLDIKNDTGTFTLPEAAKDKVVFCLIGMLEHRKGQDIAVEAIQNLSDDERKSAYFVFVGGQCYPENYKRVLSLCEQYPENAIYTGELPMADIRELYRQADCLLCPSRDDPMPIVVTEALQFSKIVICSENTGSAALLRRENGGLVYSGDNPLLLRDCISYVIENLGKLDDVRANARRIYTEYFSKEVFRKNVLAIVDRAFSEVSGADRQGTALKSESLPMKDFVCEFYKHQQQADYISLEGTILDYDKKPKTSRILLITHECSLTGAPIALQYLAEAFRSNGAQIVILSPFDGPMMKEFSSSGLPSMVYTNVYTDDFLRSQALKFDMIVLNTVVAYRAVDILRDCGTPVLWWIHDSEASYRIGGFGSCMPSDIPANVSIYCGGEYAQTQLLKYYPNYKTDVLYYMVPDKAEEAAKCPYYDMGRKSDRFVFAAIGLQDFRKGHDIFAQAIRMLSEEEIKRSQFYFIGAHLDKEIQVAVESICADYPDSVVYIPQVNRTELLSVYKQCDCIVCCSRDDPLPVFVTESMMLERTVICSENTGWAPIIEKENCGIIYHNDDPKELSEKLRYVLDNNQTLDEMRRRGREAYIRYFSPQSFQKTAENLMTEHMHIADDAFNGIVSVIIPTFNAGEQFEKLLISLNAQENIRKTEVVVIDSGSTDGTVELCRKYNVTLQEISHEEFSHSFARNKGAMLASGDILIFMTQDALPLDEYWAATLIEPIVSGEAAAVTCREHCPDGTDLYYCAASWFHAGYQGIRDGERLNVGGKSKSPDELRQSAALNDISNAIRTDVFRRFLYRFNYAEDLDLGLRLLNSGYSIKLISSTETVHGHNRNAGYYLKRGFVETVALGKIYKGWKPETLPDDAAVNKLVSGYRIIWSAIETAREELKDESNLNAVISSILHNFDTTVKQGAYNVTEIKESADSVVTECIGKLTPWYNAENSDPELVHNVSYYLENVLRQYLVSENRIILNDTQKEELYECLKKQYCLAAGNILARLDTGSSAYQTIKYLQEGV